MPNATASRVSERVELKSCPGAWVELRTMNFGEWQQRQDITMSMSIEMADNRGRKDAGNLNMNVNNEVVAMFEFQRCVVDHNLEDETGRKLNFMNRMDLAMLDPRIGNEISEFIRNRHEWTEEQQGDFQKRQGNSSLPTDQ